MHDCMSLSFFIGLYLPLTLIDVCLLFALCSQHRGCNSSVHLSLFPSGRGVKVSPSHVPPQRSAARCPRRWDPPGPGPSRSLAPAQRLISRETDTTVLGRERPALCGREPCLFERHLTQRATNWTRASA